MTDIEILPDLLPDSLLDFIDPDSTPESLISDRAPGGGPLAQGGRARTGPRGYPDIQPNNTAITSHVRREKLTPGFLEDSYPNCGTVRFKVLCPEIPKHFVREHKCRCHRPGCPVCWRSWAGRAARRAGGRIDGYTYSQAPRHITFSPEPDVIPYEDGNPKTLIWLFDTARKICQKEKMPAVAAIAHPYRIIPRLRGLLTALAAAVGENRYVYAMQQENWRDLVYFSPHVHLVAYGPLPKSDDFGTRHPGWIYRNHDEDGAGRTGDQLKQTLFYLLSHAWTRDNENAIRYWFGLSTRQLGCTETLDKQPVFCPECGTQTVETPPDPISNDGTISHVYQDLHNAPKYYCKILNQIYWPKPLKKRKRNKHRISAKVLAIWGPAGPPAESLENNHDED